MSGHVLCPRSTASSRVLEVLEKAGLGVAISLWLQQLGGAALCPCALVAATASASGVRQRPGEVELGVATVKVECGSIVGAHPSYSRGGKYAGFTLPVREKTKGSR